MNGGMIAKSQDVLVLLKWLCHSVPPGYADLAKELGMSVGGVHAATQRAAEAGLFDLENKRPKVTALKEYLVHGVKYAFPVRRGAPTRGLPTSYAAPPLREQFQQDQAQELPPVWPDPEGKVRGYTVEPLFPSVPHAARRDPQLYELLALVDALREGRARERQWAAAELERRLDGYANREALPV